MEAKTFTGEQLLAAVESGQLEREAAPIVGMVKKSEKPGCIAFSLGGCEDWIDLPVSLLDGARRSEVGQRACKDHFHPMMELAFKKGSDSTIQDLLLLLSKRQSMPVHAKHSPLDHQVNAGAIVPTAGNGSSRRMLASGYEERVFNGCQLAHPYPNGTCEGGTVWYVPVVPPAPKTSYGPYVALPQGRWSAGFDIEMQGAYTRDPYSYEAPPLVIDAVYQTGSQPLSGPPYGNAGYLVSWNYFFGLTPRGNIHRETYRFFFDVPPNCNDAEIRTQFNYAGITNVRIYSLTLTQISA